MVLRRRPLYYDPPLSPQERETSPKRKRVDSTIAEVSAAQHDVEPRKIYPPLPQIDSVSMRMRADYTSSSDQPLTDVEVEAFMRHCTNHFASTRANQERSESTLNRQMLNSITATQVTQARTGKGLLKLTQDLHKFARDLNERERRLHQERVKLSQQQSESNTTSFSKPQSIN